MKDYYKEIEYRFVMAAALTNNNATCGDVNRNHVNYGACTACARVLDDMGHETEVPVYEENGFLRIPYLKVDGKETIEFERRD